MNTKACSSCRIDKPLSEFSKLRDGLQPHCRACQSERWKRYKAAHKDKIHAKQREYFSNPANKAKRSKKRTSEEGRAYFRNYMAEYRKKNRAKLYEHERRYLDRKHSNDCHFSADDRRTLFAIYRNRCLACGSSDRLVVDHVIPVSQGGSNGIENRQLLCHSCNSKKNNGTTDFRPKPLPSLSY